MTTTAVSPAPAGPNPAGTLPVASYARRSKRATGDGKGAHINIADQHAQNRAYAAHAFPGAPVVEYDDNMSAWDPDVTREGWERLLTDVRAGRRGAVVGRYADRLTRQPDQGEALLSACKVSGTELHTTSGGHITSPLMLRIELALAAEESDQKSRRLMDSHRRLATAGKFHGGRRRFGYNDDMTELNTKEAAAIEDAAKKIMAGESVASITREWNAGGLLTPTGKQWRAANVGKLLRGRHLAGLRVHNGNVTAAVWPAIFDAATHEAVTRFLTNPARTQTGFTGVRVHPLSGLIRCGVCKGPVYGRPTALKSGPAYVCRGNFCTQAPVRRVAETVRDMAIDRLSCSNAAGVFVEPIDAERANARAAERLALTAAREAMPGQLGILSPDDYAKGLAAIDKGLAKLDADAAADDDAALAPLRVLEGLTGVPADVVAERYDALSDDRLRAVVGVLGGVTLSRASRKGVGLPWEPERVTWGA